VNGEQVTHDLRRANEFHVALLAMAGHDLRQPLQVVISSYDWLSRRVDEDLARKFSTAANSEVGEGGGDAPKLAPVHGLFCAAF